MSDEMHQKVAQAEINSELENSFEPMGTPMMHFTTVDMAFRLIDAPM